MTENARIRGSNVWSSKYGEKRQEQKNNPARNRLPIRCSGFTLYPYKIRSRPRKAGSVSKCLPGAVYYYFQARFFRNYKIHAGSEVGDLYFNAGHSIQGLNDLTQVVDHINNLFFFTLQVECAVVGIRIDEQMIYFPDVIVNTRTRNHENRNGIGTAAGSGENGNSVIYRKGWAGNNVRARGGIESGGRRPVIREC